jgi:hypothetical protein
MKQYLKGLQYLRSSAISFRSSTSALHGEYHLTLQHFLGKCLKGLCHEMNSFVEGLKNQCCGSGMFIPSRIPDPKTGTKERGEKKFIVIPFL